MEAKEPKKSSRNTQRYRDTHVHTHRNSMEKYNKS